MDISLPLITLLNHHRLKVKDLANKLGVHANTVSRWKRGDGGIRREHFDLLLKHFNISSNVEFFRWGEPPSGKV